MLHRSLTSRDHPPPPGVTLVEGGAQVCVYAGHADGVQVCLFEPGDVHGETERRVRGIALHRLGDPVAGESLRRRHRPMNRKRT